MRIGTTIMHVRTIRYIWNNDFGTKYNIKYNVHKKKTSKKAVNAFLRHCSTGYSNVIIQKHNEASKRFIQYELFSMVLQQSHNSCRHVKINKPSNSKNFNI